MYFSSFYLVTVFGIGEEHIRIKSQENLGLAVAHLDRIWMAATNFAENILDL